MKMIRLLLEIFYNRLNIIIKKEKNTIKFRKEACNMENEIMKFEEDMEFLNIGKNTLYILLNSVEIKAFRIGRVWKIPRKSVETYIERKIRKND